MQKMIAYQDKRIEEGYYDRPNPKGYPQPVIYEFKIIKRVRQRNYRKFDWFWLIRRQKK